jgi:hypothetical protein
VRLFFNTKKDSSIQTSTGENIPAKQQLILLLQSRSGLQNLRQKGRNKPFYLFFIFQNLRSPPAGTKQRRNLAIAFLDHEVLVENLSQGS